MKRYYIPVFVGVLVCCGLFAQTGNPPTPKIIQFNTVAANFPKCVGANITKDDFVIITDPMGFEDSVTLTTDGTSTEGTKSATAILNNSTKTISYEVKKSEEKELTGWYSTSVEITEEWVWDSILELSGHWEQTGSSDLPTLGDPPPSDPPCPNGKWTGPLSEQKTVDDSLQKLIPFSERVFIRTTNNNYKRKYNCCCE